MKFTKTIESKYYPRYTKIYECLDCIDPDDQYHIGHFLAEKKDETYKLTFEYGGLSLDKLDYTTINNEKFLAGFENIFRAIAVINTHHICHADIKSPNICMTSDYVFRLIDFGISFFFTKQTQNTFTAYYSYWPPESIYLSDLVKDHDLISKHIEQCVHDKYLMALSPYIHQSDYRSIVAKNINNVTIDNRLEICSNFDTYGLGLTLLDIMWRIKDLDITLVKAFRKLAYAMIHPDIVRRPHINEAHRIYHYIRISNYLKRAS